MHEQGTPHNPDNLDPSADGVDGSESSAVEGYQPTEPRAHVPRKVIKPPEDPDYISQLAQMDTDGGWDHRGDEAQAA